VNQPDTKHSKSIVIYQDGLLSYSETFIKQQTLGLKHWLPTLVGHKYKKNSLDFSMIQSQLLIPTNASLFTRIRYTLNRWNNRADPAGLATIGALAPKLIHAHFGTSAVDIWPYAKALGIPMLVTLHGFDISIKREWWEEGNRSRRKKKYPTQLDQLAREDNVHFLAVSSAIRERAITFGIPAKKIIISYIGVDTNQFTTGPTPLLKRPNRIIYVGRLVEKKGSPYLLDAFVKVKEKIPDAELIIVGKGGLESELKERILQLGLQDVTFTGLQSNQQVKELINQSRIFCLPSITAKNGDAEGLPISILEAQASGVFVVTSSSGGLGDNIIHEKTCLYFEEKNVAQLADQLIELLNNPEKHIHMIENQKALIEERFQLSYCTAQLEQLYDRFALA
jgi:glycosyltransferase involved in cell wall biosynthesis